MAISNKGPRALRLGRKCPGQRGFVLVFCAVALGVLTAFAAFAVDLGNWYLHIQHEQRAADAASLAGAAHLPDDPTAGVADANAVLKLDGFTQPNSAVSVVVHPVEGKPNEMFVSVQQTITNVFLNALGMHTSTFLRASTAQHIPPMEFGSPDNVLGSDPPGQDEDRAPAVWGNPALTQGDYWLQIAGGSSQKVNGPQWTGGSCSSNSNAAGKPPAEDCNQALVGPNQSLEYTGEDDIILHVPSNVKGNLAVDLYDPSEVSTFTNCDEAIPGQADTWMTALPQNLVPNIYEYNLTETAPFANLPYCTGDRSEYITPTRPPGFDTRFYITAPKAAGGGTVATCDQTYVGWQSAYDPVSDITTPDANPNSLYNNFHKWTRMCNFAVGNGNPTGDYVLHVTTPPGARGTNDYSVRVGILNGTALDPQTYQLSLYGGNNRMEMTSVDPGAKSNYYLGKITPDQSGATLKLQYFDLADQPLNLTIIPPRDATVNGSQITTFANCTEIGIEGTPPKPFETNAMPGCAMSVGAQVYDGQILEVDIPIPAGYSCGVDGQPDDCWFQAEEDYGSNSSVGDYLSVSANFAQDLLHIVK